MHDIQFRNCQYADCDFILKLKELCMKWYIEKIYGWDINVQREKTEEELHAHLDDMHIVRFYNKDIGITTFYEEDGKYIVGLIMIHPDYQGKGVGTQIINNYIEIARKENKEILIKTYKFNPAKKLYERLGFKVYDEDSTHVYLKI